MSHHAFTAPSGWLILAAVMTGSVGLIWVGRRLGREA